MSIVDIILIILVSLLAIIFFAFTITYSYLMARKLKQNKMKLQNKTDVLANDVRTIITQTVSVNQRVNYAFELQMGDMNSSPVEFSKIPNDFTVMQNKMYDADFIVTNVNSSSDRMKYAA